MNLSVYNNIIVIWGANKAFCTGTGIANETTILQVRILTEKVLIKNSKCCRGFFTLLQTFQLYSTMLCLKSIYV